MMDLDNARATLLAAVTPLAGTEGVALEHAHGRILAEDVHARTPVPPFANAAMDGYAVHSADTRLAQGQSLRLIDRSLAGTPARRTLEAGTTIRIFTGAALPAGADAVIAQEDAEVLEDGSIRFSAGTTAGRFVRHTGGDVDRGTPIARAGSRLTAARLGLLAAAGVDRIDARPRPRVALITTGDELRSPGDALAHGEIHDAVRVLLPALFSSLPIDVGPVLHARDTPQAIADRLSVALRQADAIVTVGGVSVGEADFVRDHLAASGQLAFWRLALKPGKPFTFGHLENRPFFGLPGNPVSAFVTAQLLVLPGLMRLAGMAVHAPRRLRARLLSPVRKTPGRRDFQRGRLDWQADGALGVEAFDRQDSHVLSTLAEADCLIDLPREAGDLAAGEAVQVLPLPNALDLP
ncbi:MAG: gephyrin-like molybdotransferase Glp [Pseudomonadales bacterium]|jgi:molybdopterin molybdotransferase|nr:gephyrin-like molybdotransferase Glp [Pseudomonadales bacterium]